MAAEPIADGAVVIRGGRIVAVGPADEVAALHPDAAVDDLGASALIVPGFVDAHCHLEWSAFDGVIGPRPFGAWLADFFPRRRRMDEADHLVAAIEGARAAAVAGTTLVADSGPTGAGVEALARAGLRGVVHLETFGAPARDDEARALADAVARRVVAAEERAVRIGAGRVRAGLSPHAPYSVGPSLWRALAADPRTAGLSWATHVAESADEERLLAEGTGPLADLFAAAGVTPGHWPHPQEGARVVARLSHHGALRAGLVAAHCVRLEDDDAAVLAAAGVAVAHCPRSNRHLQCGTAPLGALRAAGVEVALGTDSPASGGDYDLRAEARACMAAHGPAGPGAAEGLRLITAGGAAALGMGAVAGALSPGRPADLVVLEAPGPVAGHPAAAALGQATRVRRVLVAGAPVATDGATTALDDERVRAEALTLNARLR
ncbi:MAG: amidohydrolase family protein [Miltoncostaeaceae bacterium]